MNQRLSKANTGAELMNLSYEYNRGNSNGTLNGKTGQMTRMIDNLERNRDRAYEFDSLGRLIKAKGGLAAGATGVTANWTQDYSYDRYGNKTGTTATGVTVFGGPVQRDGLPSMSYNTATNRMNSAGWEYDLAGNMTRGQNADGVWQRYEYDSAGRLRRVFDDAGNWLTDDAYGSGRQRVFRNSGVLTWYVWGGDSVLAEYTSTSWGGTFTWAKSYIYAGSRLLFTATNNGAGGELKEYHHPDRLGTRMVTDPAANTLYLQSTLPFGTQFDSETTGSSNRLFTSYDRSDVANLDYAVNRTYSAGQGRFTTVDPIGMGSVSLGDPQSQNLYAYVRNSPTDLVDPTGFYWAIDYLSCQLLGTIITGFDTYNEQVFDVYQCGLVWIDDSPILTGPEDPPTEVDSETLSEIQQGGQKKCPVAPLSYVTDPVAQRFESGGGNQIDTSGLTRGTEFALDCMQVLIQRAGGSIQLTSAYRPQAYQNHLREAWDKWQLLKNNHRPECRQIRQQVQSEVSRHGITERPASSSNHSRGKAFDVSIRGVTNADIKASAGECGVSRGNVHRGGGHHFNFTGTEPGPQEGIGIAKP